MWAPAASCACRRRSADGGSGSRSCAPPSPRARPGASGSGGRSASPRSTAPDAVGRVPREGALRPDCRRWWSRSGRTGRAGRRGLDRRLRRRPPAAHTRLRLVRARGGGDAAVGAAGDVHAVRAAAALRRARAGRGAGTRRVSGAGDPQRPRGRPPRPDRPRPPDPRRELHPRPPRELRRQGPRRPRGGRRLRDGMARARVVPRPDDHVRPEPPRERGLRDLRWWSRSRC